MDQFLADFILFHARQAFFPADFANQNLPEPELLQHLGQKKKHVFTVADFMGFSENRVPVNPLVSHYG